MNTKRNDSIPEDYINVIYGEDVKPLTSYPSVFTRYLFKKYKINDGAILLDFGCGRGEFLNGFIDMGVDGHGVDFTDAAIKACPKATIKQADIENDGINTGSAAGIRGVPTVIIYKKGVEVDRKVGGTGEASMKEFLEKNI